MASCCITTACWTLTTVLRLLRGRSFLAGSFDSFSHEATKYGLMQISGGRWQRSDPQFRLRQFIRPVAMAVRPPVLATAAVCFGSQALFTTTPRDVFFWL